MDSDKRSTLRAALGWVAVALVVLTFVGLWRWQSTRDRSALRSLPEVERKALYARTMATLREVCTLEHRTALLDFCSQQAELVLQLPECDSACQSLAARQSPRPTR